MYHHHWLSVLSLCTRKLLLVFRLQIINQTLTLPSWCNISNFDRIFLLRWSMASICHLNWDQWNPWLIKGIVFNGKQITMHLCAREYTAVEIDNVTDDVSLQCTWLVWQACRFHLDENAARGIAGYKTRLPTLLRDYDKKCYRREPWCRISMELKS